MIMWLISNVEDELRIANKDFNYGKENPEPVPTLPPYIALTYCKKAWSMNELGYKLKI